MNKHPEFDFHKPFLVSLLMIVVFVFGFGVMGKTQKNVQQNGAAVALSKTTTTAGPPNSGQTVAQKVFLIGGQDGSVSFSDVWSSPDGVGWTQVTANAPWGRRHTTSLFFNNKLWIVEGADVNTNNYFSDVWSSPDGVGWTQVTANAPWGVRRDNSLINFNNKMWVIGGATFSGFMNDIWSSPDGINWTQVVANALWEKRIFPSSVNFNNKMWVMGGYGWFSGLLSDIWSSPDGINWTQVTASAPWSRRSYFSSVVFNNKMWVIGGVTFSGFMNDIWSSPDGINWTQVTASAPWAGRGLHSSFVFNNKLWVLGGWDSSMRMNDVWSSSDGINWIQQTNNASWQPREMQSVVVTPATFGLPDLTITNLTFRNQPIHVSTTNPYVYYDVTVKNSSTIPVVLPATGNTFQINLTSIPTAVPSGDLATITVGTPITLQPGQSHTFSNVSTRYDSTIRATARTYRITAKADALNLITELNETNNTYATNLTIIP